MINHYILLPAYGRKYDTIDLMLADYKAGKDFIIEGLNSYCSIRDFNNTDNILTTIYLKYAGKIINVKDIK